MIRQQIFLIVRDEQTGQLGEATITIDLDKVAAHGMFRDALVGGISCVPLAIAEHVDRFTVQHRTVTEPRIVDPIDGRVGPSFSGGSNAV